VSKIFLPFHFSANTHLLRQLLPSTLIVQKVSFFNKFVFTRTFSNTSILNCVQKFRLYFVLPKKNLQKKNSFKKKLGIFNFFFLFQCFFGGKRNNNKRRRIGQNIERRNSDTYREKRAFMSCALLTFSPGREFIQMTE